jgi:hypothetical protein
MSTYGTESNVTASTAEGIRLNVAAIIRREIVEFEDVANRLGISTKHAERLWEKHCEVECAQKFLDEFGCSFKRVLTLKEFCGVPVDERIGINLDYVCPDVVAITNEAAIGIELTAYADNESQDRLSAVMHRVHELARTEIASQYPDLSGVMIHYAPNQRRVLRGRDARQFVEQLFDFARAKNEERPFERDEDRHFPEYGTRPPSQPFDKWPLVERHASAVTIHFRESFKGLQASIPSGGFPSSFGTSLNHLKAKIEAKELARQKAYSARLQDVWLLIHATGEPRSSRVTPLDPWEISRLLSSPAAEIAQQSGFGRVVLWDGLHGGYVDLITGESCAHKL